MEKDQTFKVYAQLILVGLDYGTGERHIMSVAKENPVFPTCPWYREAGPDLKSIVDAYVKLDIAWINPKMTGLRIEEDKMYVIFAGQIPLDTEFNKAEWVNLDTIKSPDIRPSVLEAVRSI